MSAASRLASASAVCVAVLFFSPRTAGAQFRLWEMGTLGIGKTKLGLGLGYYSERQRSLTISSASGTVTVRDLGTGDTDTAPLDRDPGLLNRKFDLEWSLNGPFLEVPVALPSFHAAGGASIESILRFQVMEGDFDLQFLDRQTPELSESLQGRGAVLTLEGRLHGSLCRACPWFAEGGYRFQTLPAVDVERSRPFSSPGLQVLSDDSRLSRQTHDAFTLVGHKSGDRYRSFIGVRYRWTEVEVEDELRFFDPLLNQETTLRSRSGLDSRPTDAVVGMETRLGNGSFIGRTEIAFNDEDYGVLATITYVRKARRPFESPVVEPTLKLFWDLASLQIRDPSIVPRLLSADPLEPAKTLDSLEIGFARYQKRLAEAAGLRPIVLFVRHGTDPVEEARKRNLAIVPWPRLGPPALLSGPTVDTLVLFQPLAANRTQAETAGAITRTQIASLAPFSSLSLAEGTSDEQSWVNALLYIVSPPKWGLSKPPIKFQHTRCVQPSATHLRVSLTYAGGATVYSDKELDALAKPLPPCKVPGYGTLLSVTVPQGSRKTVKLGIIASSYYFSRVDAILGPLFSKWIENQVGLED